MQNQKSALGLDGNVTTLIGYLIPIVALILIFIEKDNKFVRFHSFQAILWVAFCVVGIIAIVIVGAILGIVLGSVSESLGMIVGLIFMLLYFALIIGYIGGLIFGAIKSFGGSMTKLPIVGNMAEKYSS
ncbi:MAG: hypothetical protein WA584_02595 [Pyrinomonadaceae bacterium]